MERDYHHASGAAADEWGRSTEPYATISYQTDVDRFEDERKNEASIHDRAHI